MQSDSSSDKSTYVMRPWVTVVAVVLLISAFVFYQKQLVEQENKYSGPLQTVRIGLALQPMNALTMIALAEGYFQQQGLDPDVKTYPSGKRALLDGLFEAEVDIVTSADVPVAKAGLDGRDLALLATSFKADNVNSLVARRDRGITQPADLRGKRIATQRASAVHYFLHLFMQENDLLHDGVELSFMKAEQLPVALARGDIDAFSMREPYISRARELLGDKTVVFSEPGLYQQVEIIVVRQSFMKANPEITRRYLMALLQAEAFAVSRPHDAMRITAEYLETDVNMIAAVWPTFQLRIKLDQSLLSLLESEARWMIDEGITVQTEIPAYADMMALDVLRSIKPADVQPER